MSDTPSKPDAQAEVPMEGELLEQRIRTLAYYMWEAEGRQPDRADEYYHRARQQLIAESGLADANDNASDERSDGAKRRKKRAL
ncbi:MULTISPECIES: DUF2934 domain-containing protein [unclassified Caballeronia]|uniref:DUF2934 domain-containing protein n=1 Tax=unclassified Caballeronia TaxID=2646786 RepID=UPI00285F77C0|nr:MULTISPECIES: DUF2934 domain-containing protein [unclassified Caballeronia]MDR5741461.1 DUF2934 domain-containing protein [Caballeronia sp. LZ016]MDR5806774.1 DUF2934 domain-containing protein [Caballeronia sp. LZ019]